MMQVRTMRCCTLTVSANMTSIGSPRVILRVSSILNCTEDDHIIVDYEGDSFSVSGGWSWAKYDVCYKYTFEFKDGKIRVIPFFKNIVQRGGQSDGKIIPLIGSNFMGKDAVFGEKSGKCIFKKGKQMAENETNAFIAEFANGIKKAKSDSDW